MTPVDQVRVGIPAGQCTEASVASLLNVSLDAVPELWDEQQTTLERPVRSSVRLYAFVLSQGYQWAQYDFGDTPVEQFDLDGLQLPPAHLELALGYHLMLGHNPGGAPHMCVGLAGMVAHDPNPSRAGLARVDSISVLVPLAQVDDQHVHWIFRHYKRTPAGAWQETL